MLKTKGVWVYDCDDEPYPMEDVDDYNYDYDDDGDKS